MPSQSSLQYLLHTVHRDDCAYDGFGISLIPGMIHMNKNGELTVFPNMTSYPKEAVSSCHRYAYYSYP